MSKCQSDRLQKKGMLATLLSTLVVWSPEGIEGLMEYEQVEALSSNLTLLRHVLQEVVKRSAITLPPVT